jgi:uptake hydrogenase large subunit
VTFPLGAGAIRIGVTISNGQICAVELASDRPQGLAQMFVGRPPEEAPRLAAQIFSLCGFSQSAAARLALGQATGKPVGEKDRLDLAAGVLAERVFETLRAIVMQWPTAAGARYAAGSGPSLRKALAASQAIIATARAGSKIDADAVADLKKAAQMLGALGQDKGCTQDTLCGAIAGELEKVYAFQFQATECLTPDDDGAVVACLSTNDSYSAMPCLKGRVMETGAFARLADLLPERSTYLGLRFAARLQDVIDSLAMLDEISAGQRTDIADLTAAGDLSGHGGFGAIECARGRLYHLAEIGADGGIARYRILAPTEWNFHPAGPFAAQLLSSRVGDGEAARVKIAQLSALFDPCVAFEIKLKEAAHA